MESALTLDRTADDEIHFTSAELIESMEKLWLNEKFAPEILPNEQDIVDNVLEQLSYMERNLSNLSSLDFKKPLHQLELDRIHFMVNSYLRKRLQKIELYVHDILKQEAEREARGVPSYLSNAEARFAEQYNSAVTHHFLRAMDSIQDLPMDEWHKQPVVPNILNFVFFESRKRTEGIVIEGGDDVVDADLGSRMLISYKSISDMVKNNTVQLI